MPANHSVLPWSRFVALSDSLTEGVGDPVHGSLRGWADRVATALREVDPRLQYWNLARRSLTTRQVQDTQVRQALELEPDLVSVIVGMNDVMSAAFDRDVFRKDLVTLVSALAGSNATLLMGTLPKDLPLLRLMPPRAARTARARLQDVCDVVLDVARESVALCIDAPEGWRYRMAECSIDGCHPNARGHAHIARLALEALGRQAGVSLPPIDDRNGSELATRLEQLRWLAAQGYLVRPGEVFSRIRGRAQRGALD